MIIGLTGYAQSGKDTVAKILVEDYGYTRVAFADKIRELLYEMNPPIPVGYGLEAHIESLQDYISIHGWDKGKQNPKVRAMLQNLGVGARTVFGELFWVGQALRNVEFEGNYVITDVRFQNEAVSIKKYDNSEIWRINRPDVKPVNSHVSETEMDNYKVDAVFDNDGTLEDLKRLVEFKMSRYGN